MAAPSAMNLKPWKFIVVRGEEQLAELRKALPFGKIEAPCAIVVCGDLRSIKRPQWSVSGSRIAAPLRKTSSWRRLCWVLARYGVGYTR